MRTRAVVVALTASTFSWASQVPFRIPLVSEARVDATRPQVLTPEFIEFIQEVVTNGTVPGLTLGIVHSGGEVEFGAWGKKTEDGDAMTVDTLFHLASCSKAFLSASIGILMDDFANGRNSTPLPPDVTRFDWYTKVKDILPGEWGLMDEWATEKATLRDIFSHQSGVPRHDMSYAATDTPAEVVHKMRYLRPAFELRQRYHYNNQMYMLGSYVISKYSGISYTEFVRQRIFTPLNMSTSTFIVSEAYDSGKLSQVWSLQGRRIPVWFSDETVELNAGPGGVISSVVDMIKWVQMLLNAGVDPSTNSTVVPKEVFEMTTTSHILATGRGTQPDISASGYGMGWSRFAYQGHEMLTHSGGIPGISTNVFFLPWDDFGLVVLSNADQKHVHQLIVVYRIIEDYFGLQHTQSERLKELVQERMKAGASSSERQGHIRTLASEFVDALHMSQSPIATNMTTTIRPSESSLLPLEAYAGTYSDPGYGSVTLCAPSSTSFTCQLALEAFAHFEDIAKDSDTLYAVLRSEFVSHARVRRRHDLAGGQSGNVFGVSGTWLFPHGYGKDISPFETWEEGSADAIAEFVVEESEGKQEVVGVGLRGLVGETTELERQGGGVKETAEVWFDKL